MKNRCILAWALLGTMLFATSALASGQADATTSVSVDKTASVFNYDSRMYQINVGFTADLTSEEIVVVAGKDADVTLVLDTSGSMVYTDAAIISAQNSADAYALAVNGALDTSKVYFTSAFASTNNSVYGSGITLTNGQSSYFCSNQWQ